MGTLASVQSATSGFQSFPWYAWLLIGFIIGAFVFHKYK